MKFYSKIIFSLLCIFTFIPSAQAANPLKDQFVKLVQSTKLSPSEQAACVVDSSGSVLSHNENMRIVPASVSKLYTVDFALSQLPYDYRYTTDFVVKGTTLYINGGGDPHFVIEHMRKVVREVHEKENVILTNFVFSPNFYFNWKKTPVEIQNALSVSLKEGNILPIAKSIIVTSSPKKYSGPGKKYQFQSAPLYVLMKQINNYSTNISSDVLFDRLGGTEGFSKYMKDTYGVGTDVVRFETGSGLRGNYTTCGLTLKVIQHLEKTLKEDDLALSDIVTVPRIDPGVLQSRAIDTKFAQAMVAKSGYVNNHHALAGAVQTKNGMSYFAVFTYFDSEKKNISTKSMIDQFMNMYASSYGKSLKTLNYVPDQESLDNTRIKLVK